NSTAGPTTTDTPLRRRTAPCRRRHDRSRRAGAVALLTWSGDRAFRPVHLREPRNDPGPPRTRAGRRSRRGPVLPSGPTSGGGRRGDPTRPALLAGLGGPGRDRRRPGGALRLRARRVSPRARHVAGSRLARLGLRALGPRVQPRLPAVVALARTGCGRDRGDRR